MEAKSLDGSVLDFDGSGIRLKSKFFPITQ